MNHFFTQILAGFLATVASSVALAQTPTGDAIPVTADNFIRAETDKTFAGIVKQGGFSKFLHFRELSPIDNHTVKRANRDTLYSVSVFDLGAGPVTISLPPLRRSTPCRMRSRSSSRVVPAGSRCPIGIKQPKRRSAMRWWC